MSGGRLYQRLVVLGKKCISIYIYTEPGAIARSVAMSLGNQEAPRSILASGTSFCEDLVMKIILR